ncbi:hypothetical protein ABT369_16660 [Dactylosporangium sp. NPDC000244]|uniref:hypothetical protein n=1 Tax=Dactylosporangium sp. NPDC000244 TaxID=3154365 RepID=UPI003328D516
MNSTTITIGLVVLALAVGGWILLRGGKEDEEELEEASGATAAPVAQPRPPSPAAGAAPVAPGGTPMAQAAVPMAQQQPMAQQMGQPMGQPMAPAMGQSAAPMAPAAAPMSSVPFGGSGFAVTAPLTSEAHAYEVRTRWQELQLRFVDDPQTAAGEAERLVDDALAGVTASLNARKDQLSNWRASGRDDTEQLRAAVHGYRDFLNHLVGA